MTLSNKKIKSNKPRKRRISYSLKIGEFICEKIKAGHTLRSICLRYPDQVPDRTTIWDWRGRYPEFKTIYNDALQVFFFDKVDEIEFLTHHLMEEQTNVVYGNKEEAMSRRVYIDSVRLRIDTLKFTLAKVASKFCKELQDAPQVAIALPNINIVNYKSELPQLENVKTIDVSPTNEEDL